MVTEIRPMYNSWLFRQMLDAIANAIARGIVILGLPIELWADGVLIVFDNRFSPARRGYRVELDEMTEAYRIVGEVCI